ncbi:MAG: hypothetical protein ACI8S6_002953 [Myxococcota bacterium]
MIWWTLLAAATAASPDEISAALADFNAGAVFPLPPLDGPQLTELSSGEVVSLLMGGGGAAVWRSVGMVVAPAPRAAIWLSCQDPHFSNAERVTEHRLAGSDDIDRATWYGFLDLPMPIADRHWAVDVWNNHDLAQKTGGRMWEHPWRLNPDGVALIRPLVVAGEVGALTEAGLDHAIYTPVNDGAWVAIALSPDETLLAYQGATDIGGVLPARIVAQFSVSGMQAMLEVIVARAAEMTAHYRGSHAPLLGGDGEVIPRYP